MPAESTTFSESASFSRKKRRERSAGSPELLGVLNYDHTCAANTRPGPCRAAPTLSAWGGARRQQISSAEIERSLRWKVLPAGQFDPAELDVVTTEPFGSGPVVELPCSGSVRGTRCVFRRDSIESTVRANHGKCPLCNESYGGLARGTQGSGQMSIRFDPGLQCSGFESGTYTIRYTFPDGTQSELMVRDFDWN